MVTHKHNEDVERFDRWSATYEDSYLQHWLFDHVHKAVIQTASQTLTVDPGVVLDIGCGTGRLLRAVATRWPNAQLIGVDPAEGMIAHARQLNPDVTFHPGSAEALPLPDYSVDLALSTLSFHHWQNHAVALGEIVRVLRPGGYFILADVSMPQWLGQIVKHTAGLSQQSTYRLFQNAGLQIEGQQPLFARYVKATIGKRALIQ